MIDCGEGTQIQLVKCGFRQGKLRHVFISHSHGDHYLGLIPMLSSFALEAFIRPQYLCAFRFD